MGTVLSVLILTGFAANMVAYPLLLFRARRYLLYQGESRVGLSDGGIEHLKRGNYRPEGWPLVVRMQVVLAIHLVLMPFALYAAAKLLL